MSSVMINDDLHLSSCRCCDLQDFFMSDNPVIAYLSRALRAFSETEHGPVMNRATIGVLVSLYFISPWFSNDSRKR